MRKQKNGTWVAVIIGVVIVLAAAAAVIGVIFISNQDRSYQKADNDGVRRETIGVAESAKETEPETPEARETEPEMSEEVEMAMQAMTLEEKILQMFMIRPEALTGVDTVTAAGDMTSEAIHDYPVGGLIYFAKNIEDPEQLREMLGNTKTYSHDRLALPMFLAVDEEGGTVTRVAENPNFDVPIFDDMRYIGETGDRQEARNLGEAIGEYLADYGFNFDFAPVADVLTNPENTVVYDRSFGTDPELVADMSLAVLEGLNSKNVIGVMKHFPGHGATLGDTHEGYAYTDKTLDELKASELLPFIRGIEDNVDIIMVGHISVPEVIGDDTPSSLSSVMINDVLKDQLGFRGVVITDALDMEAIQQTYDSAEAAVMAIEAGVDILLMPADFQAAYQGVLDAVQSGQITEERINASVEKIVNLKLKRLQ